MGVGNEHGVDLSQKGGKLPFAERQPNERVAAWVSRVLDRGHTSRRAEHRAHQQRAAPERDYEGGRPDQRDLHLTS